MEKGYYVLCVRRKQGTLIDKYYRKTREEIIRLENMILSNAKPKSIHTSKYWVENYCDLSNIKYF